MKDSHVDYYQKSGLLKEGDPETGKRGSKMGYKGVQKGVQKAPQKGILRVGAKPLTMSMCCGCWQLLMIYLRKFTRERRSKRGGDGENKH